VEQEGADWGALADRLQLTSSKTHLRSFKDPTEQLIELYQVFSLRFRSDWGLTRVIPKVTDARLLNTKYNNCSSHATCFLSERDVHRDDNSNADVPSFKEMLVWLCKQQCGALLKVGGLVTP